MERLVPILIPFTFALLIVLERVFPARPLPQVRFWVLKGAVFFVVTGLISSIVPVLLTAVLRGHAPVHLDAQMGLVPAGILGVLLGDLLWYFTHRTMHNVPWLWRWTHQMHHASERVDIPGSAIFHPFDLVVGSLPSALAAALLGLSADAAALAGFIGFLGGTTQHLNVRTPQWLGWFSQRPEAHSVHHARGLHAYNYANFPVWDRLFGTYRNPVAFCGPSGFWDGASRKVGAMLIGRDVADPPPSAS